MSLSKEYFLGGDATFTVAIPTVYQNGTRPPHYTYRIRHKEANNSFPEAWFLSFLTGPDNTSDYTYLGKVHPRTGEVILTAKSRYGHDRYMVALADKVLRHIWNGTSREFEDYGFEVMHNGFCSRCGKELTVPASVACGLGPICAEKLGVPYGEATGLSIFTEPEVVAA